MIHDIKTVRVGVLVERCDSKWIPFRYQMFHCRQRDRGNEKYIPLAEWARDEVDLLSVRPGLPGQQKLKVGETARYWVQMRMIHSSDYWGEHDTNIEILKCRRIQ